MNTAFLKGGADGPNARATQVGFTPWLETLQAQCLPAGHGGVPVEQARRGAGPAIPQSAGLPAAVMRLPRMGIAAATGYPHGSDIKVRIAMAAFDSGVMPSGFRPPRTELVQIVSEIMTAISLNPRRRHTIYHPRPPAPLTGGLDAAGSGLREAAGSGLCEVSYAEFKRACQARGPRGPLHGYWPCSTAWPTTGSPAARRASPS